MSSGLSPSSAMAAVVAAAVMLVGGGTLTAATATLSASISVASCRAACLHVFTSSGAERDARCRRNSDCFMCWNSCGILRHHYSVWSSMCTDHTACFPGCQVACKFYLNKTPEDTGGGLPYTDTSPSPPLPPAHQPPPRVSGRHHVTWSAPEWPGNSDPSAIADLIYVLMVEGDGGWRELTQTSSSWARVPAGVEGVVRAKLLAVSQEGLVAASDALLHLDDTTLGHSHHPEAHLRHYDDLLALEDTHDTSDSSTLPFGYKLETTMSTALPPSTKDTAPGNLSPVTDNPATASTTHHPSTSTPGLLYYDYTTTESSLHSGSVDPSWKVDVAEVEVEDGLLAEVSVRWSPRGPGGVEYLLSWAEESGFVSGHLLTDQLTSQLSLWPGQGYYLQVELVDSQGNSVLKSSATPVVFNATPDSDSLSSTSTAATTTPTTTTTTTTTPTTHITPTPYYPTVPQREDGQGDPLWHPETSPGSSLKHNEDLWGFLQDGNPSRSRERSYTPEDKVYEANTKVTENYNTSNDSLEISTVRFDITETETLTKKEGVYHVIVWCIGVSVGALLLLTLCSLVIFMLNRCRKAKQSEEQTEEQTAANRGSFRTFTPQQNTRNPATSWTFENFCSVTRKSKLEPSRRDGVPTGIDNDSLMENYVFMLDTHPVGTFLKH